MLKDRNSGLLSMSRRYQLVTYVVPIHAKRKDFTTVSKLMKFSHPGADM